MAKRRKVKGGLGSGGSSGPINPQELGRRLKIARTACGLSQEAVAKQFGISSRSVSQWEVGKAMPKVDKMQRLAELYSVAMEWIWGKGDIPANWPTDILRMTPKRSHEIFISHSGAARDEFSGLPLAANDAADWQIPVIERIPPGDIADLKQVAVMRSARMLPEILKQLNIEPHYAVIIRINEDTNEPEIQRGGFLIVDSSARDLRGSRNFYIFNLDGQTNLIRRISPENSRGKLGYLLTAGNHSVAEMIVDRNQLQILGRIAAVLNPL